MTTAKAAHPDEQITLLQKLDLMPALLQTVGSGILAAGTGLFRSKNGATLYGAHVIRTIFCTMFARMSIAQLQYIMPPWLDSYIAFTKSNPKYLPSLPVTLPSGISALWLGAPTAKNVLIYYHGGGFVMPGQSDYLKYLDHLLTTNSDLAIFSPAYTLAPQATYPVQLRQGVDTLKYVIEETDHAPGSVIIAGDSAGGNLALAVLSHLLHPHPEVEAVDSKGERLGGAILISPWVSANLEFPSVRGNAAKNVIPASAAAYWMEAYLGGKEKDEYTEGASAEVGWWEGAGKMVGEVLVTAGAEEILLDCIREFVRRFESVNSNMTLVVGKDEAHDGAIFQDKHGDTGSAIDAWLKVRLQK